MNRWFHLSGFTIALLVTLGVLGIYYLDPHFLSVLELKMLDLRFLSRGKIETSGKIALVTIDEKSLHEIGRWPWPRVRMAQLMDALTASEAKVVGFDIVWAEPDENADLRRIAALRQKLAGRKLLTRDTENFLAEEAGKADCLGILRK